MQWDGTGDGGGGPTCPVRGDILVTLLATTTV